MSVALSEHQVVRDRALSYRLQKNAMLYKLRRARRVIHALRARIEELEAERDHWKDLYEAAVRWGNCQFCGATTPEPACPEHRDLLGLDSAGSR